MPLVVVLLGGVRWYTLMATKIIIALVAFFGLAQLITIDKTNPEFDKTKEIIASPEVKEILKNSCYDCHSYETKYSIYSNMAPLSWGIKKHINEGRAAMNFSVWTDMDKEKKAKRVERMPQMIKMDFMPMGSYTLFHPDAKLSDAQKKTLYNWIEKDLKVTLLQ